MARNPYGRHTIPVVAEEPLFRVRRGDYRIIFRPGPDVREITVIRIGHRERVYEGFERPPTDD